MSLSASESATPHLYAKAIAASREDQLCSTSGQLFRNALGYVEIAADFATCTAGMFMACALDPLLHSARHTPKSAREAITTSIAVGLSSVLFLQRKGAAHRSGGLLQIRETERAVRASALSLALLLAFNVIFNLNISYAAIFIAFIAIPAWLVLQKQVLFALLSTVHSLGVGIDRAVIYGAGAAGKRLVSSLFQSLRLGILPVALIDDHSTGDRKTVDEKAIVEMGYRRSRSVPIHTGPITPEFLKSVRCGVLIVAPQGLSAERRNAVMHTAKQAGVRIAFLSGPELQEQLWTESIDLDGFSLSTGFRLFGSLHARIAKRAIDLMVSVLLLILCSPLLLLIAIVVKLDSPGPAMFVQKRVGQNGDLFDIYKFRSMYAHAPAYDLSPATSQDPRVTRVGRILRKTSLDELPQLMNVFLGNMSLVGPRPEMPFIVQEYTAEQRQRLEVKPGMTGLWQLSADRALPIHENIQYDLYYLRNRNSFMDIAILIHTLFFAIRRTA